MVTRAKAAIAAAMVGGVLVAVSGAARAEMNEKEVLAACEKSLCELIVNKDAAGANITCDLVKTWGAEDIKKGAEAGKLSWDWGDAQCRTKIDVARAPLLSALNEATYELKLAPTAVDCTIGGGEKSDVKFTLAPTLAFEKGQVTSASMGIDNIDGSLMKRVALKTAQLIDTSKLFDGMIAKEVNKFITVQCPKKLAK